MEDFSIYPIVSGTAARRKFVRSCSSERVLLFRTTVGRLSRAVFHRMLFLCYLSSTTNGIEYEMRFAKFNDEQVRRLWRAVLRGGVE